MLTFNLIFLAFQLGVFSYVLTNLLIAPDGILKSYYAIICKLPEWLFKPLGGCAWCFAGQLALWVSVWLGINDVILFTQALLFISFTIFFAKILTHTINYLTHEN